MKKFLPPSLLLFLFLLVAQILLSFGTSLALLGMVVSDLLGFAILRLFQMAGFLLLLFTLGAAVGAIQDGHRARAYSFLLLAVLAHFIGAILGLTWQAVFFYQAISAAELSLLLGSIMDSSILPLFVSLILAHLIYLPEPKKDTPKGYLDRSSATVRAAILISALIFAYRLIGQIIESIQFVSDALSFTFLKPAEKAMLFLDYIPVFLASFLGYFLIFYARGLYFRFTEKDTVTKK